MDLFLKTSLAELKNLSCPLLPEMLHEPADLPLEFIFTEKNPITLITFIKEYLFLRLQVSRNIHESYFSWLLNADFSRSVSALSRELGLSERQFTRKFSRMFGLPPKSYLSILRFIQARRLLQSGVDNSLAGIALAAGYCDQAHFTREFRKYSGKTPGRYLTDNV